MNFTSPIPGFPPRSPERALSRRMWKALDTGRLLAMAMPYGASFEDPDEAPDGFRDVLIREMDDEANELWPGGNGARNNEIAANTANATADFYWARACEIMKRTFMTRHKAVLTLRRLTQKDIDRMSEAELAEIEEMIEHVRGRTLLASPSE